jgi:cardiolipin-specific phospholipase
MSTDADHGFTDGDRDWMDPRGGYESIKRMKQAGNNQGEVRIVRSAGHHVYLDGAAETNRIMQRLIRETGREQRS